MRLPAMLTLLSVAISTAAAQPQPGAQVVAEAGLGAQLTLTDLDQRVIGPRVRVWFDPLDDSLAPIDQAAFARQIGWAEVAVELSQGAAPQVADGAEGLRSEGLGFTAVLRWVAPDLPLSLTLPLGDHAYRWLDGAADDSIVKLRYQAIGAQVGWYIRDDTELALGFQYLQPDFWYRAGSTAWSWLAWDIYTWWAQGRTLLALGGQTWLAAEARAQLFADQDGNRLMSLNASGRYYLSPSLGLGGHVAWSTLVADQESAWSGNLRAMGLTDLGLDALLDLGLRWGLAGTVSYIIPAEDDVEPQLVARGEVRVRW